MEMKRSRAFFVFSLVLFSVGFLFWAGWTQPTLLIRDGSFPWISFVLVHIVIGVIGCIGYGVYQLVQSD